MAAEPRQHPRTPCASPRQATSAEVIVVGAHGGAGVSTLAALLHPAWDMGTVRRPSPARGPLHPAGRPVLLVTRNTVAAASLAVVATRLLTEQGVPVAVLAVIGDGLPEPAEARYRFRVLEGRLGAVVRMPFIPAFRIAADPLAVRLPRRAHRALAGIRALAHEQKPDIRHQTMRRSRWESSYMP